jgi:hypothetical protein
MRLLKLLILPLIIASLIAGKFIVDSGYIGNGSYHSIQMILSFVGKSKDYLQFYQRLHRQSFLRQIINFDMSFM